MIHDPLLVAALIAGTTALAFWLDHRFATLSKVGAALMALFFGAVISNIGLVPQESPVYGVIEGPVVSLAIVYLLLSVRLADLKQAGPMMVALFVVASFGTALGALVGALIFSGGIGAVTWKLAGAFTGTYTGGSLNFAAVGRGLELPASDLVGHCAHGARGAGPVRARLSSSRRCRTGASGPERRHRGAASFRSAPLLDPRARIAFRPGAAGGARPTWCCWRRSAWVYWSRHAGWPSRSVSCPRSSGSPRLPSCSPSCPAFAG